MTKHPLEIAGNYIIIVCINSKTVTRCFPTSSVLPK